MYIYIYIDPLYNVVTLCTLKKMKKKMPSFTVAVLVSCPARFSSSKRLKTTVQEAVVAQTSKSRLWPAMTAMARKKTMVMW